MRELRQLQSEVQPDLEDRVDPLTDWVRGRAETVRKWFQAEHDVDLTDPDQRKAALATVYTVDKLTDDLLGAGDTFKKDEAQSLAHMVVGEALTD